MLMKRFLSLMVLGGMSVCGLYAEEQAVMEQPAGELRTYHGYSHSASLSDWGFVYYADHDGLARKVVFAENGDVWFKDPISNIVKDYWVKGHLENGKITVPTPVLIEEFTHSDGSVTKYYLDRFLMTTEYDEEIKKNVTVWVKDTEKSGVTFEYTDDDRIVQVDEGKPVMLGLMSDDKFQYYGDYGLAYTRVSGSVNKWPENVKPEIWSFKSFMKGNYSTQMEVAIDGDTFYLRGFWEAHPETICVGRIDGDRMLIESDQYLGFLTNGTGLDYYMYVMTGFKKLISAEWNYFSTGEPLEFAFDKEARTLTPLSDEDAVLLVKKGKTIGSVTVSPYVAFSNISMKPVEAIGALPDIKIKSAFADSQYGWGMISFDLVSYDVNETALKRQDLSYSLYMDDEILVFDKDDTIYPETYEGIDEPTTEIPYLFINEQGISSVGNNADRTVMFFKVGQKCVGVQSHYDDAISGERINSNITYWDLATEETFIVEDPMTGVDVSMEDNGSVVSVRYYNMAGTQVEPGCKGIVIQETTFSNGVKKVAKKIFK